MTTTEVQPAIADISTAAIRATWPCRAQDMASRYALSYLLIRPVASGGVLVVGTNGHMLGCYHDANGTAAADTFVRLPRGLARSIRRYEPPLSRLTIDAGGRAVYGDAEWTVDIGKQAEFPSFEGMVLDAYNGAQRFGEYGEVPTLDIAYLEKIRKIADRALRLEPESTIGLSITPSGGDIHPVVIASPHHPEVFWLVMPLRRQPPALEKNCIQLFAQLEGP